MAHVNVFKNKPIERRLKATPDMLRKVMAYFLIRCPRVSIGSSIAAAELSSVGSAAPLICVLFSMVDGKLKVYLASSFVNRPHRTLLFFLLHIRGDTSQRHFSSTIRFLQVISDTLPDHFMPIAHQNTVLGLYLRRG